MPDLGDTTVAIANHPEKKQRLRLLNTQPRAMFPQTHERTSLHSAAIRASCGGSLSTLPLFYGVPEMKRTGLWLAMACLALTGVVRAEGWGRTIPNTFVSRYQDKAEVVPSPAGDSPVVQGPAVAAPMTTAPAPIQHDGYPFVSRCGTGDSSCCSGVWTGYSRGCGGCGPTRNWLGGCGSCGIRRPVGFGCGSCNVGCGGCFNSFAGGSCCNSCGVGGLGWGACGLQAWGGCGCGVLRHGTFRRSWGLGCGSLCGSGCSTGCSTGCGMTTSAGCGCSSGTTMHTHPAIEGGKALPPAPMLDNGPATGPTPAAPAVNDKSAFRSRVPAPVYYRAGY